MGSAVLDSARSPAEECARRHASVAVLSTPNLLVHQVGDQLPLDPLDRVEPFCRRQTGQQSENLRDHHIEPRVVGRGGDVSDRALLPSSRPSRADHGRGPRGRRGGRGEARVGVPAAAEIGRGAIRRGQPVRRGQPGPKWAPRPKWAAQTPWVPAGAGTAGAGTAGAGTAGAGTAGAGTAGAGTAGAGTGSVARTSYNSLGSSPSTRAIRRSRDGETPRYAVSIWATVGYGMPVASARSCLLIPSSRRRAPISSASRGLPVLPVLGLSPPGLSPLGLSPPVADVRDMFDPPPIVRFVPVCLRHYSDSAMLSALFRSARSPAAPAHENPRRSPCT